MRSSTYMDLLPGVRSIIIPAMDDINTLRRILSQSRVIARNNFV